MTLSGGEEAGPQAWPLECQEGLTALVIEIVHGTLGGVIEGAGLVHVGASPGEQQ